MIDRPVGETVRATDAMERENDHLLKKHAEHCNFIGKEARSVFSSGLPVAALKCSLGFNTCRSRD